MKAYSWAARTAAIGATTLVAACSAQSEVPTERTDNTRQALLTVRGDNAQDTRAALLALDEVKITADGRAIAVDTDKARIDWAEAQNLITARFAVPEDAKLIRVVMRFDDFGGYEAKSGEAGVLDARGTSLNFELQARELAASGKAELKLDVARSIVMSGSEGRVFTPHFQLSY